MADNTSLIFGDYSAKQDKGYTKSPVQGLAEVFPGIVSARGCLDGPFCKQYQSPTVANLVKEADLIFVTLGTGTWLVVLKLKHISLCPTGMVLALFVHRM